MRPCRRSMESHPGPRRVHRLLVRLQSEGADLRRLRGDVGLSIPSGLHPGRGPALRLQRPCARADPARAEQLPQEIRIRANHFRALQRSTNSAPGISSTRYPMKKMPKPIPKTSSEKLRSSFIASFANPALARSRRETNWKRRSETGRRFNCGWRM